MQSLVCCSGMLELVGIVVLFLATQRRSMTSSSLLASLANVALVASCKTPRLELMALISQAWTASEAPASVIGATR